MPLSYEAVLLFVLSTDVAGRLTTGRVERNGTESLNVYSPFCTTLNEYISGVNFRSWCIVGVDGEPIEGWHSILPEDRARLGLS